MHITNSNFRILFILAATLLFVAVMPFLLLFGPDKLRNYLHRELIYKVITSEVTQGLNTEKEKSLALFNYVHTHLFGLPHAAIIDKHPLNDLLRGTGTCDQASNTLITLARKANIKGHLIFLRGFDMYSHHGVCDLYIDGKYRIFDPDAGYIFFTDNQEIATFENIQDKNINVKSEQLDALEMFKKSHLPSEFGLEGTGYFKLYQKKYEPFIFRNNYQKGLGRFLLAKYIDVYYDIFGSVFLKLFQGTYLRLSDEPSLVKARLKHLSFRFESALADYDYLIAGAQNNFIKSEAIFFKGQAFWDMQKYNNAIVELERLLKEFPKNQWKETAFFYIGNSYEKVGNFEKAKYYYSKIAQDWQTPAPTYLMRLMNG